MTTHHCYVGEAYHAGHRFRPKGRLRCYHQGLEPNPSTRLGAGGFSARLFVGLNVGDRKAFNVSDVVDIVWKVRKRQGRDASASILAQKGIYESFAGKRVVEPSVQIIIIDLGGLSKRAFTAEMKELSETLCKRMKQETVILEIQRRGVVTDVFSVTR